MNFKSIPIIDSHCHLFKPGHESNDFRADFNCSLWKPPTEIVENTIFNHKMIRELAKLLKLKNPEKQNEVVNERNKQYKNDPKEYIKRLFGTVNLDTLLVDTGFPHEEWGAKSLDINEFKELIPCNVYPIYRIDTIMYTIFKNLPQTFEEVEDIVNKKYENEIKVNKVIAFKSIIAYETGLEMQINNKKDVESSYNNYKKNNNKIDEKIIRDYFTILGLKKCKEHDIPMQFHTGIGSAPILDLRVANPILLQDLLALEEIRDTKVVITHSGFPFTEETGYLTSIYPNLYCDVTAIAPYFGTALRTSLLKLFEMAPMTRIMFGTDGGVVPETFWFGALQGIKDLEDAFNELIKYDWVTSNEATKFAQLIIHDNAKKLYKI